MFQFQNDTVKQKFEAVKLAAAQQGRGEEFQKHLDYLDKYGTGHPHRTRCTFLYESGPFDFGVKMEVRDTPATNKWRECWYGALLFHGTHDGFGSGGAPTLAVTVAATDGWSLHT